MELSSSERMDFYIKMGNLLGSGISLHQALDVLADQQRRPGSKKAILAMRRLVEKGQTFSDAVDNTVENTSHFEIPLMRAGEATGNLPEILNQISVAIERDLSIWGKFLSKAKGSIFMIHSAAFLFPFISYMHDSISGIEFFARFLGVLLVFYVIVYFAWIALRPSSLESSKTTMHAVLFNVPLLGVLLKRIDCYRFLFSYWILNKAGIEKKETLKIAENAVSFGYSQKIIRDISALLMGGNPLYKSEKAVRYFPEMTLANWHTALISGTEDSALERELTLLEAEIEKRTDTLVYAINRIIYFTVVIMVAYGIYRFYFGRFDQLKELD